LKSDDKAKIEAATQKLAESSHKLAEQMYAQDQAQQQQAQPGAQSGGEKQAGGKKEDDSNVVDAEYEEVKDKK
jgi:molecular chaperone DnaK